MMYQLNKTKLYSSWRINDQLDVTCYFISFKISACHTDTTPNRPHRNSYTHRTKNIATNVIIQQNSRKLLMMDILMSETCWAHKKWNKIASGIKLVFYSSAITMTHGPINIKLYYVYYCISTICFDSYRIIFRPLLRYRSLLSNV